MNKHTVAVAEAPKASGTAFQSVALLLQGGGALGAYQAGAYEALTAHGIEPSWVAGISIGAINCAIIAGNPLEKRVEKLRAYWEKVSDSGERGFIDSWLALWPGEEARRFANQFVSAMILSHGVPGFFEPRIPPPYLAPCGPEATSWYDTKALKATLEELVDFDRINAKETRFSVGAVEITSGNFAYFDNATDVIGAEHVMASGALPPAFGPVEIDGKSYWDGGLVSNTPLEWVLSARSDLDTLIFQVDLWSARGDLPRDLAGVATRTKDIQYSSRTRAATDHFRMVQKLRATFHELMEKMPKALRESRESKFLAYEADPAVYNIVELVYRSQTYEGQSKDYEFSRLTMEDHWRAGHDDAVKTLSHPEVLVPPQSPFGVKVYDFTTPPAVQERPAIPVKKAEL